MKHLEVICVVLLATAWPAIAQSSDALPLTRAGDDMHALQEKLDSAILDAYEGNVPAEELTDLDSAWRTVEGDLTSSEAIDLAGSRLLPHPGRSGR